MIKTDENKPPCIFENAMRGGKRCQALHKSPVKSRPLVSIITVVLNSPDLLEKTIKSVIGQTYANIEYIVVDGGSSDGKTIEVIRQYENFIDGWISEPDKGIYDAMNKGMRLASEGSYLQFLNAGDFYCQDDSLEQIFKNHSLPPIVYSDMIVVAENNDTRFQKAGDFTKENLLRRGTGVVCHQAFFIKKEMAPQYNTRYRIKGELDWYYQIVDTYGEVEFAHIDIPTVYYHLGGYGHKFFFRNRVEWILCVIRRYGVRTLLEYRVLGFLYKNSFSRYPKIGKVHNLIASRISFIMRKL